METKLPEDINKAAEEYVKESLAYKFPTMDKSVVRSDIIYAFKQGAKWMAEQGMSFEYEILGRNTIENLNMDELSKIGVSFDNKVIVQIRKK